MNNAAASASPGPIVLSTRLPQNAEMMQRILGDRGFTCTVASTVDAMCDAIRTDAAMVIITEEVLAVGQVMDQLVACLNQQPEWSNISVLFLLKDCRTFPSCMTALQQARYCQGITMLEMPLKPHVFLSVVRASLQHRQQQYMLRDTLQQLRESNQELEHFSHTVAHDLKAPLRGISNLSCWLREDLGDSIPSDSQEQLRQLSQRVSRMEALITDLLEYSRLTRLKEDPQPVDTEELLRDLVRTFQPSSEAVIQLIPPFPTLEARALKLSRVLSNLISNGLKYGCAGGQGTLTIAAEEHPTECEFAIADSGPGIDPSHHETIFGIFETLRPAASDSTGIGLAIVKKLVEAEGGSVCVESEPGSGATFYVTWPKTPRP